LACERPAEVSDLDAGQGRVGVRAGQRDQGIECAGGELGEERTVALGGHRLVGVHVELLERGGGDRREGVQLRAECAQCPRGPRTRGDSLADARLGATGSSPD